MKVISTPASSIMDRQIVWWGHFATEHAAQWAEFPDKHYAWTHWHESTFPSCAFSARVEFEITEDFA